jgi:Outer membrane protein beta-barrel domain
MAFPAQNTLAGESTVGPAGPELSDLPAVGQKAHSDHQQNTRLAGITDSSSGRNRGIEWAEVNGDRRQRRKMMVHRCLIALAVLGLLSSPALAQPRVEASGFVGYTFSEGIDFTGAPINGALYTRIDPAASISYGFTFGGYFGEQAEIEFLYSRQPSTLEITGSAPKLTADMSVSNYHGNFVYNFGDHATITRPFIFLGLGATSYGDAVFAATTLPGVTKFSWAFGGGVKVFPSPHAGFKAQMRWVPTYIHSTGYGGWWCDPFYGCAAATNVKYSNQFEFSGGFVARF